MNQIKKNFFYNVFYQILILILPLITVPYVSRTLGVNGIGIYSYTYSIVYYFMMIAMLGINNHGNRTIAKVRENKEELSKNFISIYSIQLFMSILMVIFYIAYVFIFANNYKDIALLQIIYIFSNMFDINWFFFGLEKFKITVTRSTILKILSFVLVLLFIKEENDILLYTLILSVSSLISQLLLFPFLKEEISFFKINYQDIKKHIKPCLIMFIPVISISLYKIMDKIMLGSLATISEVGYYEQAEKIINIPMGIITALGTVMLPRISNLVSKGDNEAIFNYISKSIKFIMFLAFPICFGLIAVSFDFIPLFLGEEFSKSAIIINYLSITIIFISFSNVIRKQYLVPMGRDKFFIISVLIGAVLNLAMNFILIPILLSIGAAISTLCAELIVMLLQIYGVKKELPINNYLKDISAFFIKSLIMFLIVLIIKMFDLNVILTIILQVSVGMFIYILINFNYVNSIVNIKKFFISFRKKEVK